MFRRSSGGLEEEKKSEKKKTIFFFLLFLCQSYNTTILICIGFFYDFFRFNSYDTHVRAHGTRVGFRRFVHSMELSSVNCSPRDQIVPDTCNGNNWANEQLDFNWQMQVSDGRVQNFFVIRKREIHAPADGYFFFGFFLRTFFRYGYKTIFFLLFISREFPYNNRWFFFLFLTVPADIQRIKGLFQE